VVDVALRKLGSAGQDLVLLVDGADVEPVEFGVGNAEAQADAIGA
jgi:hypothetical protein